MSLPGNAVRNVGFIGLGVMGGPMCRNILRKNRFDSVVCLDKSPEALRAALEAGGRPAAGFRELVSAVDAIVLSLPDGEAVRAVCAEVVPAMGAGQLLIDTSTAPVELAQELAESVRRAGGDFLDAPVARTRQAAEQGTLSIMVGGEAAVFERARPILECMATEITHCGPHGHGQLFKILNNMVLFQTVNALSEALAVARRSGADAERLFQVFSKGSADSFALRNHGLRALLPDEFPERAFSTAYARKDNGYALEIARALGVDARGAALVERLFDEAIEAGLGDRYFPVIHMLHGARS